MNSEVSPQSRIRGPAQRQKGLLVSRSEHHLASRGCDAHRLEWPWWRDVPMHHRPSNVGGSVGGAACMGRERSVKGVSNSAIERNVHRGRREAEYTAVRGHANLRLATRRGEMQADRRSAGV